MVSMKEPQLEVGAADPKGSRRKPRKRRANHVDLSVGGRLRQARLLAGASQEEVGNAVGVSFQAVQKYENGENRLSAGRLAAAAKFLGVAMSFFFPDDTEPSAAPNTVPLPPPDTHLAPYFPPPPTAH